MANLPGAEHWDWLRRQANELSEKASEYAGPLLGQTRDEIIGYARGLKDRAESLNVREDPEEILADSSFFEPQPASAKLSLELQSLTWRGDLLLGLSTAGVVALEDEAIQVTRRIFHDDLPHQELSQRLFGADFDSIHGFMDTVPGASYRGGGILHRLQHGHDLEGAHQIYGEHGLPGVMVWAQHILQDSATPTGVPAPVVGAPLAEWMVAEGVASPGKAALLVSFNVAELAATFLAGAFTLRLATLVPETQRRLKVRRRLRQAESAWEQGDLDAMIANYQEARSLSDGRSPPVELALGWAYATRDRPGAESFLAFRSAGEGLGADDHGVDIGGVTFSLRGISYLLALSEATQLLQFDDMKSAWRGELSRMATGAISGFESMAIAQDGRLTAALGDREVKLFVRPLSAAANYYMAARTAASLPFLPVVSQVPRLASRAMEMLERAHSEHGKGEVISAIQDRWSAELETLRIPAREESP